MNYYYLPFYSLSIVALYGLVYLYSINKLGFINHPDISQPCCESLWFFSTNWWPSCRDIRHQTWRIFSYQMIHDGFYHYFGNSMSTLFYGFILETQLHYGSFFSLLTFQYSIVMGALGHSMFRPYVALVGCSPGTYGYIGGCWALYFNVKETNQMISFCLPYILITQHIIDIIIIISSPSFNIAYESHLFGFISGFLLFSTFISFRRSDFCKIKNAYYQLLVTLLSFLLAYHYAVYWPAKREQNIFPGKRTFLNCCEDAFKIWSSLDNKSLEWVLNHSICQNNILKFQNIN